MLWGGIISPAPPAGDDLVDAERGGLPAADGAVEQRAVQQEAFVVALHAVGQLGADGAGVSLLQHFILQSAGQGHHFGAFLVFLQELLAFLDILSIDFLLQFLEILVYDFAGLRMRDGGLVAVQHVFHGLGEVLDDEAARAHAPQVLAYTQADGVTEFVHVIVLMARRLCLPQAGFFKPQKYAFYLDMRQSAQLKNLSAGQKVAAVRPEPFIPPALLPSQVRRSGHRSGLPSRARR